MILNGFSPSALSTWYTKRAALLSGGAGFNVVFAGDSQTAGQGSTNAGQGQSARGFGLPAQVAGLFRNQGLNASSAAVFGDQNIQLVPLSQFNPEIALGTGWAAASGSTVSTLAGWLFVGSTVAGNLAINPGVPWDTAIVWYATNTGLAEFNVGYNSTVVLSNVNSNTSVPGLAHVTMSKPAGADTLFVSPTTAGGAYIVGANFSLSTAPAVSVINAGVAGGIASTLNTAYQPWSYLNVLSALSPALTVVKLGVNDAAAATPLVDFASAVQSVVSTAKATGSVVLMSSAPCEPGIAGVPALYVQRAYANVLKDLAASNSVPYLDTFELLGSWDLMNYKGLAYDNMHENGAGYNKEARALVSALNDPFFTGN